MRDKEIAQNVYFVKKLDETNKKLRTYGILLFIGLSCMISGAVIFQLIGYVYGIILLLLGLAIWWYNERSWNK